jgi:lysyl-tRNA synthetase class 2
VFAPWAEGPQPLKPAIGEVWKKAVCFNRGSAAVARLKPIQQRCVLRALAAQIVLPVGGPPGHTSRAMSSETHEQFLLRKQKLEELRKRGIEPFGGRFEVSESAAEATANFAEGRAVTLAGRLMSRRDMGRSQFADLKDGSGRIQLFVQQQTLGREPYDIFKRLVDIGDIVGVSGHLFKTKTGQISVRVERFVMLSKALRPLPKEYFGIQDVELRHRQRYLHLIEDDSARQLFRRRSQIIREVRRFLDSRGFLEVETPMMQPLAGGAAAEPFKTHHKALGIDLYMRIAPELYLKRLLVGGFERIYELNRNFRNEGISRKHNPEFTMLEAYQAYGDFETMMELVESLVTTVAQNVFGTLIIHHGGSTAAPASKTIDLTRPWRRVTYREIVQQHHGQDWFSISPEQRRERASKLLGCDLPGHLPDYQVTYQVFEKTIEPTLIQPTFVTHLPQELVLLAKPSRTHAGCVDVFELVVNGQELAPAYSELNDPIAQRDRFLHQAAGQEEKLDEDFLQALEYGMPPAGGMGMGIDRLTMMLTGADSIRDVILFPQLRPRPR